jgi:hypothetical protein
VVGLPLKKWRVLNFEDLLESEKRAARSKIFLDIEQLRQNRGTDMK